MTGDVLVRQEQGTGAQPWTMNSFEVTKWLEALRRLERFDADIIVPSQGPALHDSEYLHMTRELYEALITQTHRALEQGAVRQSDVRRRVDVDALRRRFTGDDAVLNQRFEDVVAVLIRKIIQEAHDGITPPG